MAWLLLVRTWDPVVPPELQFPRCWVLCAPTCDVACSIDKGPQWPGNLSSVSTTARSSPGRPALNSTVCRLSKKKNY